LTSDKRVGTGCVSLRFRHSAGLAGDGRGGWYVPIRKVTRTRGFNLRSEYSYWKSANLF